ncbi:MAG TPA: hypothetical protein VG603_00950 [Chitinophagales bacterium]|nr:hypothetical protein [Chitinophagales bacterium]
MEDNEMRNGFGEIAKHVSEIAEEKRTRSISSYLDFASSQSLIGATIQHSALTKVLAFSDAFNESHRRDRMWGGLSTGVAAWYEQMASRNSIMERIAGFGLASASASLYAEKRMLTNSFGLAAALHQGLQMDKASKVSAMHWALEQNNELYKASVHGLSSVSAIHKMHSLYTESSRAAQLLSKYDWKSFKTPEWVSASFRNALVTSVVDYNRQYNHLAEVFKQGDDIRRQLGQRILEMPAVEIINTSNIVQSFSPQIKSLQVEECEAIQEVENENYQELVQLLHRLNPSLVNLWTGANEALKSKNEDKVRHISASLRELMTQIIHQIAPTDKIKAWTNEAKYYHEGKPTREARFIYITERLNDGDFSKLIQLDIRVTRQVFELLNSGTHAINSKFSDNQTIYLVQKVKSVIVNLLHIHFMDRLD